MKNQRAKNNSTSLTFERNHHYHRVSGLLFMSTILHKVLGCTIFTYFHSSRFTSAWAVSKSSFIHHDAVAQAPKVRLPLANDSEKATIGKILQSKSRCLWLPETVPESRWFSSREILHGVSVFSFHVLLYTVWGLSTIDCVTWLLPPSTWRVVSPTIFITCDIAPKISWLFPHRAVSPHNLLYKWYSSYGSAIEGRMGKKNTC